MEEKVSLKDSFVGIGQKLGKAIMMPISILPVAGLFFRDSGSTIIWSSNKSLFGFR